MDGLSFATLRHFVVLADSQSFSAAARQLRKSPSAVTKQIVALESSLKVALVHRTTRGVSLTAAGHALYRQCVELLSKIDSIAETLSEDERPRGHLRVTAPPSISTLLLGPNLGKFLSQNPSVTINLFVTSDVPDLVRERIDVAVLLRDKPISKQSHIYLAPNSRVLCAAPGYLKKYGVPKSISDLESHQCLASRVSDEAEEWSFQTKNGLRRLPVKARLLSDNGELLRQACLGGAGIANLYLFHVQGDINAKRIVPILTEHVLQSNSFFVAVPHRQYISTAAQAFISFVKQLIADTTLEGSRRG